MMILGNYHAVLRELLLTKNNNDPHDIMHPPDLIYGNACTMIFATYVSA